MASDFQTKFDLLKNKHKQGIIVGLNDLTGVIPREDIDVLLIREPKLFNLLILALRDLKNAPQDDIMGYFQMAGIHCFPLVPWNKVEGKKSRPTSGSPQNDGYCPHGLLRFPTWHRPYLAMLEQGLFIRMVEIAEKYEEPFKSEYFEAAKRFRLPYWDYYRPRGEQVTFPGIVDKDNKQTVYPYDYSTPRIFTDDRLMVRVAPTNELQLIRNPFWNYCFNATNGDLQVNEWDFMDSSSSEKALLLNRQNTTRHPYKDAGGIKTQDVLWDNPMRLNSGLNEARMDSNRIALQMLSKGQGYDDFDDFASTQVHPPPNRGTNPVDVIHNNSSSLEGLHNAYHALIGGLQPGGHMTRVPTAAFDPVFWFHHGQIERMFAIWQSIHKGEERGWFSKPEDAKVNLTPFYKDIKDNGPVFYDSEAVQSWEMFGYTYSEIQETPDKTIERLEEMYRWSVPQVGGVFGQPPPDMRPLHVSDSEFFQVPGPKRSDLLSDDQTMKLTKALKSFLGHSKKDDVSEPLTGDTEIWDWQISDRVKRMALDGAFGILYFVKDDLDHNIDLYESYGTAPTFAGMTYIFATSRGICSTCKAHADAETVAQNAVSITSQLLDYTHAYPDELPSLRPEHVKPFLSKRLRWRVIDANGGRRDPRDPQLALEINLLSYQTTPDKSRAGELPKVEEHKDVIANIINGASPSPTSPVIPITPSETILS